MAASPPFALQRERLTSKKLKIEKLKIELKIEDWLHSFPLFPYQYWDPYPSVPYDKHMQLSFFANIEGSLLAHPME